MALPSVTQQELELAQASYARCQQSPGFFREFYQRFLASDETIPPYFTNTRFDKQEKLLQHGISLLLIYARRPNPNLLERLADRHGPSELNIPPRLFPIFVESLLGTVKARDPQYDATTERAWREALAPGIAQMQGTPRG